MITEISKFVETIPPHYHTEGLKPALGLHIIVELDENGNLKDHSYESYIISKKAKREPVWDYLAEMEYYSKWIDSNKCLDVGGTGKMKIHSAIPYALWFRKDNLDDIHGRLSYYFKNIYDMQDIDDKENKCIEMIEQFCKTDLIGLIRNDPMLGTIKSSDYIKVYFRVEKEKIVKSYHRYLDRYLFLKDTSNIKLDDGRVVGMTSFLTGDNEKKMFLRHQTAPYVVNEIVDQEILRRLYKFERILLSDPRKLPNPLPIFVDEQELLNSEVVRLYRSNPDRPLTFHEIIRQLFEQKKEDLSNYYLMNWKKAIVSNKLTAIINDFDFVPQFRYKLSGFEIKNPMGIKDFQERKIDNIFQFELDVVRKIFNDRLVVQTNSGDIYLNYFVELDSSKMSATTYQNILKYRTSFYDYIYKSRTQAITGKMFYDLIISAVVDDIKRDEKFIREKLNILFSLNHIFDTNNNNFKGVNMASKIPEYQERMRKLFRDENYHIAEDDEFAFAAGQLIYYILKQSKSSNKSHALLEPFISKSDPEQFRQMIIRGIDQYKHAFEWYGSGKGRFEKLTGEIMGYECKTNIKEMLPVILAGYFSQSLIYEPSQNTQTKQ
jgi:CRISPR-associated protein Csh1